MAGVTARLHLALMADANADANFLASPMDASLQLTPEKVLFNGGKQMGKSMTESDFQMISYDNGISNFQMEDNLEPAVQSHCFLIHPLVLKLM